MEQFSGTLAKASVLFAVGFALSLLAFVMGAGLLAGMAALVALLASGMFLTLAIISGQARKDPAVGVGDRMLEFTAPRDDDETFDSRSLHGRPFLLKFFRGHW